MEHATLRKLSEFQVLLQPKYVHELNENASVHLTPAFQLYWEMTPKLRSCESMLNGMVMQKLLNHHT